jgi:SAM-dependent methyltransferase
MVENRYEAIGASYTTTRREDPRLKARIVEGLGAARSVLNVGAGAGSYEPQDRLVVAIEPSRVMSAQRCHPLACVIQARADNLPLHDQSIDAAMAILSLHHWDEGQERGVRELRRVAREAIVLVTIDAAVSGAMWLMAEYLPEVRELDHRIFPRVEQIAAWLGGSTRIEIVEIPRDTPDWTLISFWAHPERVLDERARQATSGFARMSPGVVERAVSAVRSDLESGRWDARHGHLRKLDSYDAGLRLIVNTP